MTSTSPPTSFDNGRYTRTGLIHEGFYADIYEVYDQDTGARQALKMLKLSGGDTSIRRALFDKEVTSLSRLKHPHVVELVRHFTDSQSGALCIALEYIPSAISLRTFVENVAQGSTDQPDLYWTLGILDQLIQGLERAHQLNIVHRDFNPNNVVLAHGGSGEVKIIDFGIAKLLDQFGTTHMSLPNFLTYPYVSPEQAKNYELNIEHDYFTFGLVALVLLTWRLPTEQHLLNEGDINALLEQLPEHVGDPLHTDMLRSLILALTQRDPHERPRPTQIRRTLQEVRGALGERPVLGLKIGAGIKDKMRAAGFHSSAAFQADLNQGTLAHYREATPQDQKVINVHFFGKNTWLLTRTDDWGGNQEQLVAVDAGRLEPDERWRQRNAVHCRYQLEPGAGNAKQLMDELFERQRLDSRALEEEKERRDFFELSSNILDLETERARHITFVYDKLDKKTNPGYYRLHIEGVVAHGSNLTPVPATDIGALEEVLGDLDSESQFAVGMAKRRPRNDPAVNSEQDTIGHQPVKQRVFGTFHSFLPESRTLLIRKTSDAALPKQGQISHIDQGLLRSIARQRSALITFIKDRAVNPYLSARVMKPGQTNSVGTRQPLELIQPLRPDQAIRKILSHTLAAQDFFLLQGPPGTGKTVFIAELIAQILKQNKRARILLAAQPNSAVEHAMQQFRALPRVGSRSLLMTRDNDERDSALASWTERVVTASRANAEATLPTFDGTTRSRVEGILGDWQERLPNAHEAEVDFVRSVQVHGTTCLKVPILTDKMNGEPFDWVILDEAAKALDTEVLMALVEGRRFVLVGDHKQLPPYLDHQTKGKLSQAGFSAEAISESLFERLFRQLPIPNRERLGTQFRMHSTIGKFVSDLFYDGALEHGTPDDELDLPLPLMSRFEHRVIWLNTNTSETHVRPGYHNLGEAQRASKLLRGLNDQAKCIEKVYTVSVITPYEAQVSLLEQEVVPDKASWTNLKITVATVDSFQGKQSDLVLYSLVRTSPVNLHFVADLQRVNVACSRARRLLVILGCADVLKQQPIFAKALSLLPSSNVVR